VNSVYIYTYIYKNSITYSFVVRFLIDFSSPALTLADVQYHSIDWVSGI